MDINLLIKNLDKDKIKKTLKLDDVNLNYFLCLVEKYLSKKNIRKIKIAKNVFPVAILSDEDRKKIKIIEYEKIKTTEIKEVNLWSQRMLAGIGSSIKINNKNLVGTKALLLLDGKTIYEYQIEKYKKIAKEKWIKNFFIQDLLSPASYKEISKILINLNKTKLKKVKSFIQYFQPCIFNNLFTEKIKAPAGHAIFSFLALKGAYDEQFRPIKSTKNLISFISNGEDINAVPDKKIISYILKNKIPIVMLTTDKTSIDKKGGQISIFKDGKKEHIGILEKAQAEKSNDLDLFYEIGLRDTDHKSLFNTNMVIINYEVLSPKIEKIIKKIGEKEFLRLICPDVIENVKKTSTHTYTQLEGALGSSILNLNKFWQEEFKEQLVYFINIPVKNRTDFFMPIKTAFDYFLLFHSDSFTFSKSNFKLINKRGELPKIDLDPYYNDINNVLSSFKFCSTIKLKELYVEGIIDFSEASLEGKVKIINKTNRILNISDIYKKKKIKLKNVQILIDKDFNVKFSNV